MKRKIYLSMLLLAFFALLASVLAFFFVMYADARTQAFRQLEAESAILCSEAAQSGVPALSGLPLSERLTWVAADGTVLYDSRSADEAPENHLSRPEIQQALSEGSGQSERISATTHEKTYYYAQLLPDGSVLRLSSRPVTLRALIVPLLTPAALILLLLSVTCAFLAARLSQQIIRPINAIDPDAPKLSYPELRPLLSRIEEQNRTIRAQLSELSRRQREFSAITENMREGFLILDRDCRILSCNHSALQTLDAAEAAAGADVRAFVHEPELLKLISGALDGAHTETMKLAQGVSWQILANPVVAGGRVCGAVLIFVDVTEHEQREALRREFSANVSHELKTPLTSISGFAELMKEGLVPQEKMLEFSGDIYRESRRLMDLIDDIIALSRLDEGALSAERTQVDLYELSGQILEILHAPAQKKNLTLSLLGDHACLYGVRQLLYEMLFNLCDNAVKYNVPGGSVTVSVWKNVSNIIVSVADTGIGIPRADQSRVFERFYRVNKSHSRELGGTGLGLSIVKHAAQYHGAHIELSSTEGRGTAIAVVFPSG